MSNAILAEIRVLPEYFGAMDIFYLANTFTTWQLRREIYQAEIKSIIARAYAGTEYEAETDHFPWADYTQTREIYEQMKKILEKAGATFDDVIKTVDYIAPQAVPNYLVTAKVRREYFKGNYPAATGIVVNRLLRDDWLIEISALAVID